MKPPFHVQRIDFEKLEEDICALRAHKVERNYVTMRCSYMVMMVVSRFPQGEELIGEAFEKLIEMLDNLPRIENDKTNPHVRYLIKSLRFRLMDYVRQDKLVPKCKTKPIDASVVAPDPQELQVKFSQMEQEVIQLKLDNATNYSIAAKLGCSARTIERITANIKRKLMEAANA